MDQEQVLGSRCRRLDYEQCLSGNLRELVLAEDDEEAGLAAGAVTHDHQLLPDGGHPGSTSGNCKEGRDKGSLTTVVATETAVHRFT